MEIDNESYLVYSFIYWEEKMISKIFPENWINIFYKVGLTLKYPKQNDDLVVK